MIKYVVLFGGISLGIITILQVLIGKRIIAFKGPLHMKVHRSLAYILVAGAAFHGLGGASVLFGWPFAE